MKILSTQFGVRENTASSRRHASHLSVDSLPVTSEAHSRHPQHRPQHRQPTPALPSCSIEPDSSFIAPLLEAATGGGTLSSPATVIIPKESRPAPVALEPFVSADEAAKFLCIKRRFLLELARRGIPGGYALGTGSKRKIWVFRLTELAASVARIETPIPNQPKPCTIKSGSPR